jgi:hypothetical protein
VVQALDAGAVEADVVGAPADAELVATGGQLADEVGQLSVVGVAAGLDAQEGDEVLGDAVPVGEERRRGRSRNVKRALLAGCSRLSNSGAYRARPSRFAAR